MIMHRSSDKREPHMLSLGYMASHSMRCLDAIYRKYMISFFPLFFYRTNQGGTFNPRRQREGGCDDPISFLRWPPCAGRIALKFCRDYGASLAFLQKG